MIKMQDKLLNVIDKDAQGYELEAVISPGTSNEGKLYIFDGFKIVMSIKFNFQTSHCSFYVHDDCDKHQEHLSKSYLEYKYMDRIQEFLQAIDCYMMEYDMEKNAIIEK